MSRCDQPPHSARVLVLDRDRVVTSWPFECDDPPTLGDLDRLARLQLTAQRMGLVVRVAGPPIGVVELLELAGLADLVVAPGAGSGLEALGEPEEGEEPG